MIVILLLLGALVLWLVCVLIAAQAKYNSLERLYKAEHARSTKRATALRVIVGISAQHRMSQAGESIHVLAREALEG